MTDEKIVTDDESTNEESFAELFAASQASSGKLKPGAKVQARVLQVSNDWVFLDIGQKGEGVLDRRELTDPEGNLTVATGDTITAWFVGSSKGELRFSTKVGGAGAAAQGQLEDAWRSGIPVEGVVEKEVKGGFEVKIGGSVRAFCPFSQISLRRAENTAAFVGKHLPFRVIEYGERGRNIIVSHRAMLEEEQRQEREKLKESLTVGTVVEGTVSSLRDFGAFISIGAMDGLLPVSEAAWGKVRDIRQVLSVGDQVKVVVKQIDWEKERITFSLKDTLADPWESVPQKFAVGTSVTGTVVRLAPFGAFVALGDGIDGLLHISRLGGGKKIAHPKDVLKEGETVEVLVEGIDLDNRKISLALADFARAAAEADADLQAFRQKSATSPQGMGTLGELLKAKINGTKE